MKFVKYNLPDGQTRPALVLGSFDETGDVKDPHHNMTVFLDASNDTRYHDHMQRTHGGCEISADGLLAHVYSAPRGTEAGTWAE